MMSANTETTTTTTTRIVIIPTGGSILEVVRMFAAGVSPSVVGWICFQPWERSYAVHSLEGRILKAGLVGLDAAKEWALAASWE